LEYAIGTSHEVKLIAPKLIRADLKSNKSEFNDAAAIAEALPRPTMCLVLIRSI